MKGITVIFSSLVVSFATRAQETIDRPDSLAFTYTEQKVDNYYHFSLEGPSTYKFISRHKVKEPKVTKDFDFSEGDLQLKYVQKKSAFMMNESGDTLASIVLRQDWFDIIMPDGRLYKFKRLGKYQWEYSLNGTKVLEGNLMETRDKRVVSWKLTESEPDAALALSNVAAAYSWSAVHKGMSQQAVGMAVLVGVILTVMRYAGSTSTY
jgi:hypothetical protein